MTEMLILWIFPVFTGIDKAETEKKGRNGVEMTRSEVFGTERGLESQDFFTYFIFFIMMVDKLRWYIDDVWADLIGCLFLFSSVGNSVN